MNYQSEVKNLTGSVARLKNKNILIVGDVGLDEYVIGSVKRISPEAPVPVVQVEEESSRLGLSANVAQNVSALGGNPYLLAVIGQDPGGEELKRLLLQENVKSDFLVIDKKRPTTRKLRVMAQHHHIVRVDYEKKQFISSEVQNALMSRAHDLISKCDAVIIQDYAKGVLGEAVIQDIIKLAKKNSKLVTVDPHSSTPLPYYRGADLMTPNLDEASALTGSTESIHTEVVVEKMGAILMDKIATQRMVITRGKDGMSLFEGGSHSQIPTFARKVFDVTGAGDTVIATLTLALSAGLSLRESCLLGNFAAGVVVGKVGCVPCSSDELNSFIQGIISSGAF